VFITYSPEVEEDEVAALRMRDYLGQRHLSVSSNDDMPINTNIQQYVNEKLKESDYVIVVLSKRALVDSWESGEAALSIVLERASENKVIPVSLDNGVVDPDFFFESLDNLNEKIKKYQGYMKRAIDMGEDSRAFQADLNRLISAKSQLPQIIEKIKRHTYGRYEQLQGHQRRDL
jgi:TIR domain.